MSLGSLAFAWPLALTLLPIALGFLIYVYRKRRPPQGILVGTIFLLQKLPRVTPRSSGFLPPIQFWIDLLVLTALILGLAQPFLKVPAHKIAVVIDNSLSMSAIPLRDGRSLLSRAVEGAREAILRAPAHYEFELFASSPNLHSVSSSATTARDVIQSLDPITFAFSNDMLGQKVERLLRDAKYDGVWTYTDQDLSLASDSAQTNTGLTSVNVRDDVKGVQFSNVSIVRLHMNDSSVLSPIKVTVKNFSDAPRKGSLKLSIADQSSQFHEQNSVESFSVGANAESEILFKSPESNWQFGRAELLLSGEDSPSSNVITEDDRAWISRTHSRQTIQLVGPLSPLELKIEGLLGLHFDWKGQDATSINTNSPTLFHRSAPPKQFGAPSLVVFPESSDVREVGRSQGIVKSPSITRWLDSHPITSYINLQTLSIPEAHVLSPLSSSQAVVSTNKGVVLNATETSFGRVAVSGFELFPFTSSENPALSILTLNLFKWVYGSDTTNGALSPYENLPSSFSSSKYIYIDSSMGGIQTERTRAVPIDVPGIIRSGTDFLAVQYNDETELDSRQVRKTTISSGAAPTHQVDTVAQTSIYLDRIIQFLLLLLLADLLFRTYKHVRAHGN